MHAASGMHHHCFATGELQLEAVIGEVFDLGIQMQQQRFHIAHAEVVLEGVAEQGLQGLGMLMSHHSRVWGLAKRYGALALLMMSCSAHQQMSGNC